MVPRGLVGGARSRTIGRCRPGQPQDGHMIPAAGLDRWMASNWGVKSIKKWGDRAGFFRPDDRLSPADDTVEGLVVRLDRQDFDPLRVEGQRPPRGVGPEP